MSFSVKLTLNECLLESANSWSKCYMLKKLMTKNGLRLSVVLLLSFFEWLT